MRPGHDRDEFPVSLREAHSIDPVCERFSRAWRQGDVPRIEDHVQVGEVSRRPLFIELALIDLYYRWKSAADGHAASRTTSATADLLPDRPRLEDYIACFSLEGTLGDVPTMADWPVDAVLEEYWVRRQWGDRPGHEEYLQRFPQLSGLADRLVEVDREYRSVQGEQPNAEEYRRSLPEHRREVESGLSLTLSLASTADRTGDTLDCERKALKVRCPHCRSVIEILEDAPLVEITCLSCGSQFSLVGDEALAYDTAGGTRRRRQRFGHFELTEQLGSGAFGTVWKAHDTQLDRIVAVKIPRKGQLNREETEMFLREARAAAQLRHPNVVTVHEVGIEADTVYQVSDFIDGVSLADWLKGQKLGYRQAAELCAKLADALHHAHEHGVVHRDLKPNNIMLDRAGEPHLMDFGLAKRDAGEVTMTMDGQVLGTPAYMSPEQARGEGHAVDRRTDVYSLGVILFQLLTGEIPFRGNIRMILKQVIDEPPPQPRKLDQQIPRDLETICLKCLEKSPGGRYRSARDVADELRRHLRGEPILARPISRPARLGRWCRRNPLIATLIVIALLLLILTAVVGAVGYVQTALALQRASIQKSVAETALNQAKRSESRAIAAQQRAQELAAASLVEQVDLLRRDRSAGWTWTGLANLSKALGTGIENPDLFRLRGLASSCLMGCDVREIATFAKGENSYLVAFSDDGEQLAIAQYKAQAYATCKVSVVRLSDNQTRSFSYSPSLIWQVKNRVQDGGHSLAFSRDGRWLLVGTRSGWIHRWDLSQPSPATASWQAHEEAVNDLFFSPDGKSLYSTSYFETLARWDVSDDWKRAARRDGKGIVAVALSRNGLRLAVAENRLCWLDPITLKDLGQTIELPLGMIRYCGDSRLLAGSWKGNVVLVDEERAEPVIAKTLTDPEFTVAHENAIVGLETSPDGSLLLSSDLGGRMKLWDVASGRLLHRFAFPGAGNVRPAFSPDGRYIATTADLRVLLLELRGPDICATVALQAGSVRTITASPDDQVLATLADHAHNVGTVRFWDLATGSVCGQWSIANWFPRTEVSLSFRPAADVLALSGDDQQLHLLRPVISEDRAFLDADTATSCVFGMNDQVIWGVSGGDQVIGWDVASMNEVHRWSNQFAKVITGRAAIHCLAAGRNWLLAGTDTFGAILLRAENLNLERRWDTPGGPITSVAIARDDSLAALGTQRGAVRVVHIPDGRVLADRQVHEDRVVSMSFREDGSMLAAGSHDGTVSLHRIDGHGMEQILSLSFENRPVDAVCFSQQGKSLAVLLRAENAVRLVRLDRLRAGLAKAKLDW